MIDGKAYKTLKRHVSRHGMTPAEYRERYRLKADYPMTAPAYSEHRCEVAKTLGLGRKPKAVEEEALPAAAPEPAAEPSRAKRGRKAAAVAAEPAPAPKKHGRPAKARPEVAEASSPQRPEPMFD